MLVDRFNRPEKLPATVLLNQATSWYRYYTQYACT